MSHPSLNPKVHQFGRCVTRWMTEEARAHGALNLAQGFPQEPPPEEVQAAAIDAIRNGKNIYADMRGLPELRTAVARNLATRAGLPDLDGDRHVTITCGTTEAMLIALTTLVRAPDDEVLLLEPWYENYPPQVVLAGGTVRTLRLEPPCYRLTEDALRRAVTPKTRVLVLTNPHNPTGRVFDREELGLVAGVCQEAGIYVVVDEIYEHYLLGDAPHVHLASLPGMAERTITISGISKSYACTGWRVGWLVTPDSMTDAVRRVHDFVSATVPTPFQIGAVTALNLPPSYYATLRERYRGRRDRLVGWLKLTPLRFVEPEGAYYLFVDTTPLGTDSRQLTRDLLLGAGVAVVPGDAFHPEDSHASRALRMTFAREDSTLDEAGERIARYLAR